MQAQDDAFPSRIKSSPHLSRRQYARLLSSWLANIGLDPAAYGTHSLRRTKAAPSAWIVECLNLAEDGPMNRGRSALSERLERTQKRPLTLTSA